MSDLQHVDLYLNQQLINYTPDIHKIYTSVEWGVEDYFQEVLKVLQENNIKSFIDVGGCTGEVANILLEKILTIESGIVFEPSQENYNFILKNVISEKITIENKAVFYGKNSLTIFKRNDNVGGWSSMIESIPHRESVEVECVELDDYLKTKTIDFIKIDVEGSEYNILENSCLLKEVKFIELELHHEYFDIFKGENNLNQNQTPLDFVKKYLPDHEVHCFLGGIDLDETHAGNIFLVKK
jgi:FkbM family methyltransferase